MRSLLATRLVRWSVADSRRNEQIKAFVKVSKNGFLCVAAQRKKFVGFLTVSFHAFRSSFSCVAKCMVVPE